jgi:DNA polymerase III epsilon subunit-like protein
MDNNKYIFLDIETDGGYKIVQISYIITCSKLNILSEHNHFLNDGTNAVDYYKKITEEFIIENGKHPSIVLEEVSKDLKFCNTIIGHNIGFDIRKLTQYFYRYRINFQMPENTYDTMHESKNIVKSLNVKGQIKYPKLGELSNYFGVDYDHDTAHDGLADVMVTYECYKKLVNCKNSYIIKNNLLECIREQELLINKRKQNRDNFIKYCDNIFNL